MSWYLTSLNWIDEQRKTNPGMTPEGLKKHCSKDYPVHKSLNELGLSDEGREMLYELKGVEDL